MRPILCPFEDLERCARVFDNHRLTLQKARVRQTLTDLSIPGRNFRPALRMWNAYQPFLTNYLCEIHNELFRRGLLPTDVTIGTSDPHAEKPWFWGIEEYHDGCKNWLAKRDPDRYGSVFPDVRLRNGFLEPIPAGDYYRFVLAKRTSSGSYRRARFQFVGSVREVAGIAREIAGYHVIFRYTTPVTKRVTIYLLQAQRPAPWRAKPKLAVPYRSPMDHW